MKKLSLILACLISLTLISGCKNPLTDNNRSRVDDDFDNDDSFPISTFGLILPLPNINTVNASTYPVSGVCDPAAGNVVVSIGTPHAVGSFPCYQSGEHNGYFSGVLDVSGVTSSSLEISVSQGILVAEVMSADLPSIDLTPIASAPSVTDQSFVRGLSWNGSLVCSEIGEVVVFTGQGLAAGIQTHRCHSSSTETFNLRFSPGTQTTATNPIHVSSVDESGNPSLASTTFNLPIDNVRPIVSITNGGAVFESEAATFTITVTEPNFTGTYEVAASSGNVNVVSGGSGTTCSAVVCEVEVTMASIGLLLLSVAAEDVEDLAGNKNSAPVTSRLNILDDPDPVAESLTLASVDLDADAWFELGDTVSIDMTFSENVLVDTSSGVPFLPVTLTSGLKQAHYVSGSGTNTLRFEFLVQSPDAQCNGNVLIGNIDLNGGSITDSFSQNADYSRLPSVLGGVNVDTTAPQAPTVLTLSGGAMNSETPQLGWTPAVDACGPTKVLWAIGTTPGGNDVQDFINIGNVNSYKGFNGVDGAHFQLQPQTQYYLSLKALDLAGNESIVATSDVWSFSCVSPMSTFSRMLDLDSSEVSTIIDENGVAADHVDFTGLVNLWQDLSPNFFDVEALGPYLNYSVDTNGGALITKDSFVAGQGLEAMSVDVVPYSGNFTFSFIAKATDANLPEFSALFSSASDENLLGSWQLDKGGDVAGCEDQFRIHFNDENTQQVLCGPSFDTETHLFMIKYNSSNKTMRFFVDNVEYDSKIWADAPTFEQIRLLENRTSNGRSAAQVYQATILDELLSPVQEKSLTDYLSCKWSLSL